MEKLLLIIWLMLPVMIFSQNQIVPKHCVSIQFGVNDRGLVGYGYDFNSKPMGDFYFGLSSSIGVGNYYYNGDNLNAEAPSLYASISPSMNFGSGQSFFTLGGEFKGIGTRIGKLGLGAGLYFGGVFYTVSKVVFKLRFGLQSWFGFDDDGPGLDFVFSSRLPVLPILGVSLGYGFKHR